MTVVRRELPLSSSASHLQAEPERRIVQARALQSCPHRRDVGAPQEAHVMASLRQATATACRRARVMAAQTKPTNSRAMAAMAMVGRLP